jgi:Zn-dependent protease
MSIQFILSILIALTIHEAAHAYSAQLLGDPTAKNEGRVSLNPIKHLDFFGTLLFIMLDIGWGKPVPVNPNYFENPRRDQALVALAGPASNFLLAAILAIPLKFFDFGFSSQANSAILTLFNVNILLCAFNLIPFPPLDGSKILALLIPKTKYYQYEQFLNANLSYIILFLISDIYLFQKLFGFSITRTILESIITIIKTIIFLGT